jgi:hypothetical protein
MTSKNNGRQPQKKFKMEDDLKKNGRRPQSEFKKSTLIVSHMCCCLSNQAQGTHPNYDCLTPGQASP